MIAFSVEHRLWRGLACAGAALALVACGSAARRGGSATSGPRAGERLAAGADLTRELAPGQTHRYRLDLPAGSFVRVEVEKRGVDLSVTLEDPYGGEAAAADGSGGRWVEEILAAVPATGGTFHLVVAARPGGGRSGRYRLRVPTVRPAQPGDGARVTALGLYRAALHLRQQGRAEDSADALARLDRARALFAALGDDTDQGAALYQRGEIAVDLSDYPSAVASYRDALALQERNGARRPQVATLDGLGWALTLSGQPAEGRRRLEEALTLSRELADPRLRSQALSALGAADLHAGHLPDARTHLEAALADSSPAEDPKTAAIISSALGIVYRQSGEVTQAIEAYRRASELARDADQKALESGILYNLGNAFQAAGSYLEALEHYERARRLAEETGDRRIVGRALSAQGTLYSNLGESERAIESLERALALARERGATGDEAESLMHLGWIYEGRGEEDAARRSFLAARNRAEAAHAARTEAYALHGLGRVELHAGETAAARDHLEQALRGHQATHTIEGEIAARLDLGGLARREGHLDLALEETRRAVTLSREIGNTAYEAAAHSRLAALEREAGDLVEARRQVEAALDLAEGLRHDVLSPDLRASLLTRWRTDYELEVEILMELARRHPGGAYPALALAASERARARSLAELLTEARVDIEASLPAATRRREQALAGHISWLQDRLLRARALGGDKPTQENLRGELERAREESRQLEWQIRRQNPRFGQVLYPAPLNLAGVQALLDERTALLEYFLGEKRSYLFVVTRSGVAAHPLPPAADIAALVEPVRRALGQPGRRNWGSFAEASHRLYQTLVAPAEGEIATLDRLLIAPDRDLYYLPFEALLARPEPNPTADPGSFLLARWTVAYVPSATVLGELPPSHPTGSGPRFVAFADPVSALTAPPVPRTAGLTRGFLDTEGRLRLAPLPGAEEEVRRIARLFPQGRTHLLLGRDASEEAVKTDPAVPAAELLHFATHGLLDEADPAYSALLLAPGASGREDGLLQVHEIFNLELHADLVVLSACETGLGPTIKGEGLVGLARAFFYAGVPSVVLSLWRVDDASTADLQAGFYRHLVSGEGKAEALSAAKLELARSGRWSSPYYWAPFVLNGRAE